MYDYICTQSNTSTLPKQKCLNIGAVVELTDSSIKRLKQCLKWIDHTEEHETVEMARWKVNLNSLVRVTERIPNNWTQYHIFVLKLLKHYPLFQVSTRDYFYLFAGLLFPYCKQQLEAVGGSLGMRLK